MSGERWAARCLAVTWSQRKAIRLGGGLRRSQLRGDDIENGIGLEEYLGQHVPEAACIRGDDFVIAAVAGPVMVAVGCGVAHRCQDGDRDGVVTHLEQETTAGGRRHVAGRHERTQGNQRQ